MGAEGGGSPIFGHHQASAQWPWRTRLRPHAAALSAAWAAQLTRVVVLFDRRRSALHHDFGNARRFAILILTAIDVLSRHPSASQAVCGACQRSWPIGRQFKYATSSIESGPLQSQPSLAIQLGRKRLLQSSSCEHASIFFTPRPFRHRHGAPTRIGLECAPP